jgi:hypothetical protein
MKKLLIVLILFVSITQIATAQLDLCVSPINVNTNCTMVSNNLDCGVYTYEVINITGELIESGTLATLNESRGLYYFNLSQGEGEYIINFCDNTTKQVEVTQGDENNMIIGAIILIPMLLSFIFLFGSWALGDEHDMLKIFLFLLSMIPFYTSLHFGLVSIIKFYNFEELQNAIGSTVWWSGLVFGLIVTYFMIYLLYKGIHTSAQNKEEKLKY